LQGAGFELRAVRPPTVPPGTARLRVVTHAFNTTDQIANLAKALLARKLPAPGVAVTPPAPGRPIVVVGTDTGIGKTVVSAALLRALADAGPASYWKPVQTGDDDDTSTVEALSGVPCPRRPDFHFALPAAPHEAAQAEGDEVDVARLDQTLRALRAQPGAVVIELAGGLHVPLTDDVLQADWLARHRPEVVLVARSGLGTLNHTQLTLEALARRGLRPRALVLVGDPHPANRATLARRTGLEPYELPWLDPLTPEALQAWVVESELRP
ncbi:MAG: dethiobiotin synthase, partial [Planctomycetota bacterium]|nr:dethiobiotin synthase [Planctomycetota bacterium]